MRKFSHINARSLDEAVLFLARYGGKAEIIAGGTDILGKMKDEILQQYPEALINIKTIRDLDFVKEEQGRLRIGALMRLEDAVQWHEDPESGGSKILSVLPGTQLSTDLFIYCEMKSKNKLN